MTSRSAALLVLTLLISCTQAPSPETAPRAPQLAATVTAQRVVLLSLDGLGADALAQQKNLAAFDRLARDGATARVIPVNPTLSGPAHVSILTGADPQRHAVVSNRFHLPGTPIEQVTRGMSVEPEVETLVEAARRQGKRVGVVPFPTVDNRTARRSADFGLAWSDPVAPARLIQLTRDDFKREWVPPTWTSRPQRRQSFSPIMRARVEWSAARIRRDVDVVAYDTTDDRVANYDTYFVEAGEAETNAREWFAVSATTAEGLHGSWSKVVKTTPRLDVTIYWGPIGRNDAWPASFRELLDAHAGFSPGPPEEDLEVDPSLFVEQMERLAAYHTRVQTLTIERMPFDLLLAYQPQVDQASHEFLGTPDAERAVGAAFVAADRGITAIADALEPTDALVVIGDHGVVPHRRAARVNAMLVEGGFASRWRAYTSGGYAQLYRFAGPDDSEAVVNMLTASGLFERVEKKSAAIHRHNGDVVAYGWPDVAALYDDAPWHQGGGHGALNTHRELHTVLFAFGTGVAPGPLGEISQTRIARYVSGLLGITAPNGAE